MGIGEMMKRLTLILATLITASVSISGQVEHTALTVAQCQTDQRLWFTQLEDATKGSDNLPAIDVIRAQSLEMMKCEDVDPGNRLKYYATESENVVVEKGRMEHFLDRHDMWKKFLEEDAAGKR
jgi:hypothetical protein